MASSDTGSAAQRPTRTAPASASRSQTSATASRATVRLADTLVALADLRTSPSRYMHRFLAAKAQDGHAFCQCQNPEPWLVIRSRADRFHLAGWPGRGSEHAPRCEFFKVAAELSGRSAYTGPAITEDASGTRIRLNTPLTLRGKSGPVGTVSVHPKTVSAPTAQSSASLLGLLHWMWEQAQLHQWDPRWKRTWASCHQRLTHHAADCKVNNVPLDQALYTIPPYTRPAAETNAAAFSAFSDRLGDHGRLTTLGLVLGEVKQITESPYGFRCAFRHLRHPIFAGTELIDRVRSSYRAALGSSRPDTSRQIALVLTTRTSSGNLRAVDLAVMLTNTSYIPAESSYEVVMADHLAAACRSFVKPLRYDVAAGVLPDFVLLDCMPPTFVEVYGITGMERYDARKRAKRLHYEQAGRSLIEWDVTRPLPAVSRPLTD